MTKQLIEEINMCYGKGDPRTLDEENDWLNMVTLRIVKLSKARNTKHNFNLIKGCISPIKLKFYIFPDVYETLKTLKSKRIKTCVIANSWPSLNQVLTKLELKKYFDTIVISSKVGYEKPAKEIFEIALRRLHVKPYQMVHIGNEDCDVTGARNAGITPVLIDRKDDKKMDCITIRSLNEFLKLK